MTFLSPSLALIAAGVLVPLLVILYFLKLKRRQVEVSSTLLWKKAIQDLQANAPFQRLRNNVLLILQLLALAAGLLALAQPQLRSEASGGRRHVIVLDRSASMRATDGDPSGKDPSRTRLDQAKARALELVDTLREPGLLDVSGDEAMVVAFDVTAERLANFTGNKAELRRVIESVRATDAPTRFAPAFATARAFAQPVMVEDGGQVIPGGAATVHLFSDGRLPDLTSVTPTAEDRLVYYPMGGARSWNVGVVGLRAERGLDEPNQLSVFVSVQNSDARARSTDVQLAVDGRVVGVRELALPAARAEPGDAGASPQRMPGVGGVVFTLDRPEGGVLTVQLRTRALVGEEAGQAGGRDVLASDDFGYLVVPPARRLSVALVTAGNLFLRKALEAQTLARLDVYAPLDAAALFDAGKPVKAYDVYVLDSWLPEVPDGGGPGKAGPGLPLARVLAFNVTPGGETGVVDKGAGEATVVLKWDRDHPALRGINLDALAVNPSRAIALPQRGTARVLVEGVSGPLIVECSDPSRRALVATFDLMASGNWMLDLSFFLYVSQGLWAVAEGGSDSGALRARPGGDVELTLPAGASDARVTLPDSSRAELLVAPDGRAVFGPAVSAGIYTFSWVGNAGAADVSAEGRVRRAISVNLEDAFESDVAAAPPEVLSSRLVGVSEGVDEPGALELWPWLVVVALAVLLVEWWVYHRKATI
jgi:hypothetical protein